MTNEKQQAIAFMEEKISIVINSDTNEPIPFRFRGKQERTRYIAPNVVIEVARKVASLLIASTRYKICIIKDDNPKCSEWLAASISKNN